MLISSSLLNLRVLIHISQGQFICNGTLHQHENSKFNDQHHYTWLKIDSCLFLHHNCILVVYVDVCLIFSEQNETIDGLIQALCNYFLLQDGGDVHAFLSIQITKDKATKTISTNSSQCGCTLNKQQQGNPGRLYFASRPCRASMCCHLEFPIIINSLITKSAQSNSTLPSARALIPQLIPNNGT